MALGNGTESLSFDINLIAPQGSPDHCGVFWNNVSVNSTDNFLAMRIVDFHFIFHYSYDNVP